MFTPSDKKLQDLITQAADELLSRTEDFLDEGEWVSKFYRRCDELGIDPREASTKLREVADEILSLQLAKHMLARIIVQEA